MNPTYNEDVILNPNRTQAPSAAKLNELHSRPARHFNSPLVPVIGGQVDHLHLPLEQLPPSDINRSMEDPDDADDWNDQEVEPAPHNDPSDPASSASTSAGIVERLRGLLGEDVVLLPVCRGEKRPIISAWQKTTIEAMADPAYAGGLAKGNIGVLLGQASGQLCSIDFDTDGAGEEFLALNPSLHGTLRTRGSRGFNAWVRISGRYPLSGKLKDKGRLPVGEWRGDGNQTVIHGVHPSGCDYHILHEAAPLIVDFESIIWPETWLLPWKKPAPEHPSTLPAPCGGSMPAHPDDGAPIILPSGKVSITECADKLFRRIAPTQTMFMRGGAIMERETQDDGSICLSVIKPPAFRSRIEGVGQLQVWRIGAHGAEVLKPTTCPEETAKALMETLQSRELLPRISTVVNCPVAIEVDDGLVILGKGYHPDNGGILVIEGDSPPEVPICEAVAALVGLLAEFDFQTPGDRSRALASLIAPGLKLGNFIKGFVPADVAEADQSQSGKTYRQRVGCAIYNETPSLIAARKGGVGSVDESFSEALIKGKPFIQLDNVRGKMDSQYIESFLTAVGSFGARVPHRGEVQVDPQRFLVLMTSNGVESTRDFANRSSIIRIRKRIGFSYQTYPAGDLLSHVKANQPYFLGCVFAVIREWIEFGKPRTSVSEHDFKEWAQTLDWIVQHIFHAAPLLEGHLCAQERVSNPALSFLRVVALEVCTAGRLNQALYAGDIVDLCVEGGIEIPGVKSGNSGDASRTVGVLMRRVFVQANVVAIDEFTVTREECVQARSDGGNYLTKVYRFNQ